MLFTFILLNNSMSFWIINGFKLSFDKLVLYLSYVGPALGVLLVYKLSIMKNLTFVNQMFLIFLFVDSFVGFFQTFFLEKLRTEK